MFTAPNGVARALIWSRLVICIVGSALYDLWTIHW